MGPDLLDRVCNGSSVSAMSMDQCENCVEPWFGASPDARYFQAIAK